MKPELVDNEVLDLCMRVNGLRAFYPLDNKVSDSILEPSPDMIGKFGLNKGFIAFVTPSGDYYVSPFYVEVVDYLYKHGYENNYLYVPFSNGDEPSEPLQAMEWKKLCISARQLHNEKEKERRRENTKSIAENKGIKRLPSEAYDLCLLIPDDGLKIKGMYEEKVEKPVHEFELKDYIGTYCQCNGRIAFVDDRGHTYVTPFRHEIRNILKKAGYKESEFHVPLANEEELVDLYCKEEWERLCLAEKKTTKVRIAQEKVERIKDISMKKGLYSLPPELYRLTFEIPDTGVETIGYGKEHETLLPVDDFNLESKIGTYCQNAGRVVFVDNQGRTFVTPFCSEITHSLQRAGYKEGNMRVPFSNGEIPANDLLKLRWKQLCALSRMEYEKREKRRKVEKLNELAVRKNISQLPPEVYELSLKIPKEGFEVVFFETERDIVRPVRDFELERCIGTYYNYLGRLVFVDCNGDTYVTPHCDEVARILNEAGYNVSQLYVPLANGEKIIDPEIANKWNSLCSRLPEPEVSGVSRRVA